jgi:integrase/recombinase XerD
MRQAQTLNEAQLPRVIQYCRSRRHPARDETIILFSFYAGLRAKEIAALTRWDVFDESGNVREQLILSASWCEASYIVTRIWRNQETDRCYVEN